MQLDRSRQVDPRVVTNYQGVDSYQHGDPGQLLRRIRSVVDDYVIATRKGDFLDRPHTIEPRTMEETTENVVGWVWSS